MSHPFAVVDTCVAILLCTEKANDSPKEIDAERRRTAARSWVQHLTPRVRFALPTVVIAELGGPHAPPVFFELLARAVGRFRVVPFTRQAAMIAARMATRALAERPKDQPRSAVKFDTLIAATAHAIDARYLLTDDRRDYRAPFAAVSSPVEVIRASEPRPGEQLAMAIPIGTPTIKPKPKRR